MSINMHTVFLLLSLPAFLGLLACLLVVVGLFLSLPQSLLTWENGLYLGPLLLLCSFWIA